MRTDIAAINAKTISINGVPIAGSAAPSGSVTTFDQLDADTVLAINGTVVQGTFAPGMQFSNFDNINVLSGVSLGDVVKYGTASTPATNAATGPISGFGGGVTPTPTPTPTPSNLTVANNPSFVGSPYSSQVSGKSAGSTFSLAGAGAAGLNVAGSTISGTPTTVGPVNLVENFGDGSTKTWTGALTTSPVRNTATRFWLSGGGTTNNAISAFQGESSTLNIGTIHHCIEVEGKPTRVRLILANQDDVDTQDYLGASMVASPSMWNNTTNQADMRQDTLFANPTIFDFGQNGNAIISVPPRTNNQQNNNLRFSDWKPFVAVERTDGATAPAGSKRSDGSLPYLMYVRLAVPIFAVDGTTSRRITYFNRTGAEWATGRAQLWASSDVGSTAKLTGAWNSAKGFAASNEGFTNYAILAGVEYEYEGGKIITVMACGSSYTSGGSDDLQSHSGVQRGFWASSTKAQPVESINYGMATKPVLEARQAFDSAIAAGLKPTHLQWEYANPNSCGKWGSTEGASQSIENDLETARLAVFASAQNAGVVPFVINGTPRNDDTTAGLTTTQRAQTSNFTLTSDTFRLAALGRLNNRGFLVADINTPTQDGASPQRLKRTENGFAVNWTNDFIHSNGLGYRDGWAPPIRDTVLTLKAQYLGTTAA
ncbi:hypothetical protein O6V14_04595 [Sphingomonas faeni]|uniref:hypothetical protein n=1 Tax=Sphingomonas faeni TaxID=185950 RepID=UPI0033558C2C